MDKENLTEILKKALEMEEKGHDFYSQKSKEGDNKITRETFEYFADQELLHIDNIKNFYHSLKEKGEFLQIDLHEVRENRKKDDQLFAKKISEWNEKINPERKDKEAIEFALDFEKRGYNYYNNILKRAEDENLVKLLEFLLDEEDSHYDKFIKLYEYMTDTDNWYMYDEGVFPQGG